MIKNLIFDLGDVFIDLDRKRAEIEMQKIGVNIFSQEMIWINNNYEKGEMTSADFVNFYHSNFKGFSKEHLIATFNSILADFPLERLEFLESIVGDFRIFLLSNTNEIHIDFFKNRVGESFYNRFFQSFEKVYYSYEMNCRKPDAEIFEFVVKENNLKVTETLFVDDTLENIVTANQLGFNTWHIDPKKEQVVDLFSVKKNLFLPK
jgi:putative hydrolase of the HAD superfamily